MNVSTAYIKVNDVGLQNTLKQILTENKIVRLISNERELNKSSVDIIIADISTIAQLSKTIDRMVRKSYFLPVLAITNENETSDSVPVCVSDIIKSPINVPEWKARIKTYLRIRDYELSKLNRQIFTQLFDSLFMEFPCPTHMVDSNLNIVQTNKKLLELIGKKQHEIVGKKCYEIYQNKKDICDNCTVQKVLEKKAAVFEEDVHIFKGDSRYFEKSAYPLFSENNEVEFVVETAKEVTEKVQKQLAVKQDEENYRKFIEKSSDLIILFNRKGKIIFTNKQIEKYGYTSEQVAGTSILDYIVKDNLKKTAKLLTDLFDGKVESYSFENKIVAKDGRVVPIISNDVLIQFKGEQVDLSIIKDISPLKEIEEQLRNNSTTLNNIFNNSVVAIYVQERDGTFIDVNQAAVKIYGFDNKSQLIGKNPSIVSDESKNDLEKVKNYMDLAFNGESQSFVFWGKRVDGSSFPKYVTIEKGSYFGKEVVFAYAVDITDWFETQKQLEESEEKYKTIFQTSPDAISINKMDKTFLEVNDVFLRMFNLAKNQVIGKTPKEVGLKVDTKIRTKYLRELIINGSAKDVYFPVSNKTGNLVYTLLSSQKIVINGVDHILSIYKDISSIKETERILQESEEKYRAIVENIHDGLYIYDGKKLRFVNDQMCEILGFSKEEMFKKDVWEFFHPDDRERIKANAFARLTGEDIPTVFSSKIVTKTGEVKYGEFMVRKIAYQGEIAIMGAVRDVTDKILFNEKLIEAKNKAEENSRLKTAFLNNMNHELRTPMNAIMGFSELMDKANTEQKSQFAGIIRNSAKQLLSLLDDVLYLSRLQSERLPVKNNYFSPCQVVNDVVNMFSVSNKNSNVSIVAGNPDNYSNIEIYADESKIRQIVTNFASNAVKHTFEGTVEIGFFIDDKIVEYYVKDTGVGIPDDEQSKIFETFYRGRQSISAAIRGTGLGLSIAKQIADQLDGEINLSSDLGRGTYFSFSFPLRGMKTVKTEETESTDEKSFKGWENIEILVAEDDPNNYLFYEIILKKKIKQLDHAWNGKDAVDMVNSKRYDLVLMDIKMPVMDGLKATKLIKAKFPDLPVIAQTAYTSPEEKKGILAAGCDEYLSKPVKKQKLLKILEKYAKA